MLTEWNIEINSWRRKIVAATLVLTTCGALAYNIGRQSLAAWITRNGALDPAIYERAVRYDPENAEYHFALGQIYSYSTRYLDSGRARDAFETAVRLNPDRSVYWLELSKYYEHEGEVEHARRAMNMALQNDPNNARTHWAAANLYVRLEDTAAAGSEIRRTAQLDVLYLPQVLDLARRMDPDPAGILAYVPNTSRANLAAVNFFVSRNDKEGADLAWQRLKSFETKTQERLKYVEYLVSIGKPREALDVFAPASSVAGAFFNAGFETEMMNGGFDWHFTSRPSAMASRDMSTAKEGRSSFLVGFDGTENVDYDGLWHWLLLVRGKPYELRFWMKTEAISTDEGMFVEVDGHASEKQGGTTDWKEFVIPFIAASDVVKVRLRRLPSRGSDNLLLGKVWIDAFAVTGQSH
jgi:tetratricopeptide (TPR) repeat protein